MPTGYTAKIYDGKDTNFVEFALECSRAFGAMISLRDEPDAEIPEAFEVNSHYADSIARDKNKIEEWKIASDAELLRRGILEKSESLREKYEYAVKKEDLRKRYLNMITEVEAWTPPSDEHLTFKDFMIRQLKKSIDQDCRDRIDLEALKIETEEKISNLKVNVEEYRAEGLAFAERNLQRSEERYSDEAERTSRNNKWNKELRDSLLAASESQPLSSPDLFS